MITRREAALRLDISVEMARKHDMPAKISEAELAELDENPPAWLAQSRANRTGKKAVWVQLTCSVCGFQESVRPKKWWPEFTYLTCNHHSIGDIPLPAAGFKRSELDGIGTRFIAIIDVPVVGAAAGAGADAGAGAAGESVGIEPEGAEPPVV